MNLLKLHTLTSKERYRRYADAVFKAFSRHLKYRPTSHPALLSALDMRLDTSLQIIIMSQNDGQHAGLADVVRRTYFSNKGLVLTTPSLVKELKVTIPIVRKKILQNGRPTAYVCEEGRCERPTNHPDILRQQLRRFRPLLTDRSPPPLTP